MLDFLALALSQNTNPFARAFKYAVLWGLTIQIFVLALGKTDILAWRDLAFETGLRLVGALIITMAVYYLYRLMRGRGGPGASGQSDGPKIKKTPPHLRRVK
jgi:hypothetical protein